MCKVKDFVEQHPFEKFPVDVPEERIDEDDDSGTVESCRDTFQESSQPY